MMASDSPARWPEGKACAFVLTVSFEAELSVLAAAPDAVDRAKSLSVGQYGGTRGVDRLLSELDRTGIPASWFIPAANLQTYPGQVRAVAAAGHEIANMGLALENLDAMPLDQQIESVMKAQDSFESVLGVKPRGFRAGRGSYHRRLPAALVEAGFNWSSSWYGDDLPHFHAGRAHTLVEVGRHHELDDFPYFVFNLDPPIPKGSPRIASSREVLRNWILEFDAYRAEGLCFMFTVHPEIIATPGRIGVLREFLDHVRSQPDVWIATGGDVAGWWSTNSQPNSSDHPAEVFHALTASRHQIRTTGQATMHSSEATASQTFANFVTGLSLGDIPQTALHRAKLHLLDTLGAGIAGSASAEVQASRSALASGVGIAPEGIGTPLWGTPGLVPPLQAAFTNGVASHAFELDDSGGCDHSGAVVVPAALAAASMAEAGQPMTGERLLIAITAGYELGRRVQTALGGYDHVNDAGWHSTGVCGTFAAAAAAGIVLDLNPAQLTSAIGLAGSFTGGTWAFMSDGSMSKRLHVGRAAEAGLNSLLLAREGFTGPADIFSAPWGSFLKLYGGSAADESAIYEGLGSSWLVERSSIKPYASCRSTHSAIDAVLFLKEERGISPESVEAITVHTSSLIFEMCGGRDVSSLVAAQLSMPFALATAMLRDRVALQDIALEGRTDPALAPLMERIQLSVDADQHGGSAEPMVEIRSGGEVHRRQAVTAKGASTNRLSDADTLSKFAELAGTRLTSRQVEQLIGNVLGLEALPDVEVLNGLLRTAGEPALIR